MNLSEDGNSYTIKSSVSKSSIVDLKFTQISPGFVVGKDGTSYFGTDPQKPWGRMIHKFWPRCQVEGQILTQSGPVEFKGLGMFIHALQGMKPHFAGMFDTKMMFGRRKTDNSQLLVGTLQTFSPQITLPCSWSTPRHRPTAKLLSPSVA